MTEKADLRAHYRQLRAAMGHDEHARLGAAVEARLAQDAALAQAETVYSYIAFGREVPTGRTLSRLLERGTTVLIPPADRHADPTREAQVLRSVAPEKEEPVVAESLNGRFDPYAVDLFLVPGIAWDERGYRIGFGGGFFDRLLAARRPDATLVGLAFEFQIVECLPADEWDVPVQRVVTERRTIPTAGGKNTTSPF